MLIKLAAVKSMYESRGGTSDLRLPTSEFRLLTFKASIFDMQLISLDNESNLIKLESYKLLFLRIVAWLRMSLNTMYISQCLSLLFVLYS